MQIGMTDRVFAILLALTMPFLVLSISSAAATSSTVELLMKKVQNEESWIDGVESFVVKYDVKWLNSPETLAERAKDWKQRFPDKEPDPKKYWDLRPEQDQTEVWAFDKTRIAIRKDAPDTILEHRSWDGKGGVIHEQYLPLNQGQYSLFNEAVPTVATALLPFYFQVGFHPLPGLSLTDEQKSRNREWSYPSLKDFKLLGEESVDGKKCWKVSFPRLNRLYWVDKDSGHLIKTAHLVYSPPDEKRDDLEKKIQEAWLQKLNKDGHEFKTLDDATAWLRTLPRSEQTRFTDVALDGSRSITEPYMALDAENFFGDYSEIAPGYWYPRSGEIKIYAANSEGARYLEVHQKIKVTDVQVNKTLPDDLFRVDFKEGVQVYDFRYNPRLEYKYKKDRTQQEWEELKKAAAERAAKPAKQ